MYQLELHFVLATWLRSGRRTGDQITLTLSMESVYYVLASSFATEALASPCAETYADRLMLHGQRLKG